MNNRGTNGHSVTKSLPKYMLVDKTGAGWGIYASAADAILAAERLWPGQEQDSSSDHEEPNGWDIQTVR